MPRESKTRHRRLDLVTLVSLLSLLIPTMSAAGVSASLDRSAISLNETVQLVLESDGDPDTRPDLSVLAEDFEILDRRSSHRVSVINGQRSERHLLMLRIRPRHIGELGIPAIPFGDGITEPLQLSVAPAETGSGEPVAMSPAPAGGGESVSAPNAFVEADLEPNEGYVGQELILTVEVFMDGPIQGARLHDPQVPNTRVLPLGEDHKQVVREGKSYRVYQRRYALFPQHPGRLEIGPQRFEGWVPGAGAMSGTADYASSGKQIAEDSERLIGKVLPAPATAGRAEWLPARELSLTESGPETYRAQTGQPIERRISLRADGVMARDLPVLAVPAPHQLTEQQRQPGLWDERRPQGVIGNRLQVVVLTAREPGHYRLPPISLEWWSTKTERWETAKLPARDLVVSAAHAGDPWLSPPQPANADQYAQQPPLSSRADMPHEPTVTESQVHAEEDTAPNDPWIWIALVLALAWLATMTVWWRSRHRATESLPAPVRAEPPPPTEVADPRKQAIEAVRIAYEAGDAGAAREALLGWAGQVLPTPVPSNLARLAQRCPPPLRDQILLLEEAFFSPAPVAWDKQPVWQGLDDFEPAPPEEPASFRRGKPIRRRAPNPDAE